MATTLNEVTGSMELAEVHAELVAIAREVRGALVSGDRPVLRGLARRLVRVRRWAEGTGLEDVARWASTLLDRTLGERVAA